MSGRAEGVGFVEAKSFAAPEGSAERVCQSSGGVSIPHTLPGSSRANPRTQNFANSPGQKQFTTRAVTLRSQVDLPTGLRPQLSVEEQTGQRTPVGLQGLAHTVRKTSELHPASSA